MIPERAIDRVERWLDLYESTCAALVAEGTIPKTRFIHGLTTANGLTLGGATTIETLTASDLRDVLEAAQLWELVHP